MRAPSPGRANVDTLASVSDPLAAHLAQSLRRLREARGLTQVQLSQASGVPRPTLANLESGSANPTLAVLSRVAAALSVPIEELVQAPLTALTVERRDRLPQRERDGVTVRELSPAAHGLSMQRIDLTVGARVVCPAGRRGDRGIVACERGRVEVRVDSASEILSSGDVATLRDGSSPVCWNRGRGPAVLYVSRYAGGDD